MATEGQQELNLTRRFRPKTMKEYLGNDLLKSTVIGRLDGDIRPQTILLQGSTGGGKTTMARLVAKEYLCEDRIEGVGACGKCAPCQMVDDYIETGNSDELPNLQEIDAAQDGGIQKVNAVLEEAHYQSFDGSWKIYIFDECHRISTPAQNAMLKIVEEPPERVLFIFCTTDPQNMLETLVNRCSLNQVVKKPSELEMINILKTACDQEHVSYDKRGLGLVVDRSELVIRKALMDLENVILQYHDASYDSVIKIFDEKPNSLYFEFFNCLLNKDTYRYVAVMHKIKSQMPLGEFVRNLTNFTKRGIYIYNNVELEGVTQNEIKNMKELFTRFSLVEQGYLLDFLTKVSEGDTETKLLLLGFKGLDMHETNEDDVDGKVIEESAMDVRKEKLVTSESKRERESEQRNASIEDAKSATDTLSADEALNLFN